MLLPIIISGPLVILLLLAIARLSANIEKHRSRRMYIEAYIMLGQMRHEQVKPSQPEFVPDPNNPARLVRVS